MINELVNELTEDYLDGEQRELAECIGMENYKKLIVTYAGMAMYIHTPAQVTLALRNKKIREEFNGGNYNQLAKKYGISAITVRKIIRYKQ